ncbi:Flp pilus assembly protein TadG [Variovorax boronicumulans]|uniref:TadE/TadG family type IV pilus assembly protein n=1 Tax=Variovorax boronicumulans TaxID=436515 RepID=UPI0027807F74|nr:TadE/TadG family type IV pilus assembly protein [Variovorax boronicumulans]MDQ0014255.1 Flp pilus assembly protein TadG [Variovorax boronicumulans]
MKKHRTPASTHAQRGVYAIEFAFVFLMAFTLLYAVICYGLLLTLRMGLQNAAEDGARAALRYQLSLDRRGTEAVDVAELRTNWLPDTLKQSRSVIATVCTVEGSNCTAPACGMEWGNRCQMVVTVTVGNMRQVLPPLPSFAIPDQIAGKASMLLDGRSL